MAITKPTEFGLTPDVLRELMVSSSGALISHKVGRALLHKTPLYSRSGMAEMRKHLMGLMDELRSRLATEDLVADTSSPLPDDITLPKRLRDEAAFLAAILTYSPAYAQDDEEQNRFIEEGMWWAQIAKDKLQEALLCQARAWQHINAERYREAFPDYRRGVEAAMQGGHLGTELELRSQLIAALLYSENVVEGEEETNTLLSIASERLEGEDKQFYFSRGLRYLGTVALKQNRYADAIRYLEDALIQAKEEVDPVHYSAILYYLANAYQSVGGSAKAIELLVEMGEVGKRSGRVVASSKAFARIGEIHLELNDPERAGDAFELAERFVLNTSLMVVQWNIRYQKLPLYLLNGQTEEGIALCHQLLDHYRSGSHRDKTLQILGLLLERQGNLSEAEAVLREGWDGEEEQPLHLGLPLARILIARKNEEKAGELLLSLCSEPPKNKSALSDYAEGLELLSGIARQKGEYAEAIEWLERAFEVKLSIERNKNEESMRNARMLAEVQVQEKQRELVQARRERTEEEMAELLTGLQVTHGTLLNIERRLRENLAWLEPEKIEQVIVALKSAMTDPETEQAVELVVSEADALLGLHGIDENFFEALRVQWPNLTKKQRQLCGMIRAGLNTSQIAHLLGITSNAVLTQRKRLRKRMGLSSEENLKEMIMGVVVAEDQ